MTPSPDRPIRSILHVDMDAFFVSVEELENPSLKGKAVVVGADPEGRGVVAAASYEARKYGVHSAMPIRTARQLCPQAIFLRGHHSKYRVYSEKICEIFGEFTPVVEMVSIDEAYLDLTGTERLHGGALRAADRLIRTVQERTGLNCSVGASTSHLVSKIASEQAKPHGLLYIFPGCEARFLASLPIRRMPGIGKVTEPELLELGIATIGDLQTYGREKLRARFGTYGEWLWTKSRGEDIAAYQYEEEPKSISHETTFDADTADADEIERTLSYLAQRVAGRLRDHQLFARTVGLKLRNARFRTLTRDVTLDEPTHLDSVIFENVLRMFERAWKRDEKIRLVGVRASNLERGVFQRNLLEAPARAKFGRAMEAADKLRAKFGFHAVQLARSLEPDQSAAPEKPGKPGSSRKPAQAPKKREFLGRKD
jgi:DNA polymerase IV